MRRVLCLICLVALFCAPLPALAAEEPVTLALLKAAGVQPMTKSEIESWATKGRLGGEVAQWSQALRLFDDGTLRGESCAKSSSCSSPAKGTGKWSVDEDGTFRLFLDWGRWGKHDWVGKLYRYEGYVYQHDGADESRAAVYRFQL